MNNHILWSILTFLSPSLVAQAMPVDSTVDSPVDSLEWEFTGALQNSSDHTKIGINRLAVGGEFPVDRSTAFILRLDLSAQEMLEVGLVSHRMSAFNFRFGKDLLLVGGYEARERNHAWLFAPFIGRYHNLFLKYEPAATVTYDRGVKISLQAVNDLSNSLARPGYFSNQTQPALLTEIVYPFGRGEFLVQWGTFDLVRSQTGALGFRYIGDVAEFNLTSSLIHRAMKYQHVIKYYEIFETAAKITLKATEDLRVGLKLNALEVQQPDYPERSLSNRRYNQTENFDDNGRSAQLLIEKIHSREFHSFLAYGIEKGRGKVSANETRSLSVGVSLSVPGTRHTHP